MSEQNNLQRGLIVVDLQAAFRPPAWQIAKIENILGNYEIVIATQFLNKVWSLYETELGYTRCQMGAPDSEIVIPLRPKLVFDRFSYGVQSSHIEKLKQFPVKRWDIVGCDTDACVLATCYNMWDNGIRFRVLADYCNSSGGKDVHEAALKIMARNFGKNSISGIENEIS